MESRIREHWHKTAFLFTFSSIIVKNDFSRKLLRMSHRMFSFICMSNCELYRFKFLWVERGRGEMNVCLKCPFSRRKRGYTLAAYQLNLLNSSRLIPAKASLETVCNISWTGKTCHSNNGKDCGTWFVQGSSWCGIGDGPGCFFPCTELCFLKDFDQYREDVCIYDSLRIIRGSGNIWGKSWLQGE